MTPYFGIASRIAREVDVAEHDVADADHETEERPPGPGDVEQRHDDEAHDVVVVGPEHLVHCGHEREQVRAREHHALRKARRARRVELDDDVVGTRLEPRVVVGVRVAPVGELRVTSVPADGQDQRRAREVRLAGVEDPEEVAPDDEDLRVGVVHDVRDLGRGEPPVDRADHGADLGGAEDELEQLERVLVEEGDPVAAADAGGEQGVRHTVRDQVELPVGEVSALEREGDVVADGGCLVADQVSERGRRELGHAGSLPRRAPTGQMQHRRTGSPLS